MAASFASFSLRAFSSGDIFAIASSALSRFSSISWSAAALSRLSPLLFQSSQCSMNPRSDCPVCASNCAITL